MYKMATVNLLSGFQNKFVDSECLKDYECPLCLHVIREPSLTSCCGQHFCLTCISRISNDSKPCPLCKEKTFTTMIDKKQKRKVLDLKVYCEKKSVGCEWSGFLGESEQHNEKNCLFASIDCPNNCGVAIQRRILAEHQINDCSKRPYTCEYCQLTETYLYIQAEHLPVCPKRPVTCPNECGVTSLETSQLEQHMRECSLAMVECELSEVGCEEKVKRKDLDRHMEEAARRHIQLMNIYCIRTVAALKDENLELKKELTTKNKEVANLKKKVDLTSSSLYLLRLDLDQATTYMRTTFVQMQVKNVSKLEDEEDRWENPEEFYTFPSRHRMKINLHFSSDRIEVELTHLKSQDESVFWSKTFTVVLRMLNQDEDHAHFEITRDLLVEHNNFNDEMFIKYSKIRFGGGRYLRDDSLRLQARVSEV